MQDKAANYDGEGKEQVAREGRDSGVAMMARGAEGGGSGQQWWQWRITAMADDDSGRRQRWRMMTARKIEWSTTKGKEESGRQTTTTLGQPGREHETKIKKSSLRKKDFFQQYSLSGWSFCSRQKPTILLLDLSVLVIPTLL
jgi:hypothetical protein